MQKLRKRSIGMAAILIELSMVELREVESLSGENGGR
jgi:hypothetical protein